MMRDMQDHITNTGFLSAITYISIMKAEKLKLYIIERCFNMIFKVMFWVAVCWFIAELIKECITEDANI